VHILDEPVLIPAIIRYFEEVDGGATHTRLLQRATDVSINFGGHPSIRGQLLDVVVLCKVIIVSHVSLEDWLPLEHNCFKQSRRAKSNVTCIVSGKGVLYRWLSAVLNHPDEDFMPGVKARNVCVRPETLAGADGVFAAFKSDGTVVLVSMVCAWYANGVTKEKWRDQDEKSHLEKQFKTDVAQRDEIAKLLKKKSPLTLRVLFELPRRQGDLPSGNVYKGALVVDDRNVGRILGSWFECAQAQSASIR
jgi:hypothetical protein